jgi:leucyl-tRNA synthetase
VTAIHPITGKRLPIYVTSYVIGSYGTGAVMGVPFHDERDCAFALENGLDFIQVSDEEGNLVNSKEFTGLTEA